MSGTPSPTSPWAMPEPEPYYESSSSFPNPQRPSYSPVDSYTSSSSSASHDLLRRATAGSVNSNRRLPQAPNGTSSDGARPPVPPLPYEHRGSYNSSSGSSVDGSSLTRLPSYRPPGALPPSIPGLHHAGRLSPSYDYFPGDNTRPPHNVNGYYKPVDTRQFETQMRPVSSAMPNGYIGPPMTSTQEYPIGLPEFTSSTDTSQCLCCA